jgi:hypothetical protein
VEVLSDASQEITAHRVLRAVAAKKADHPFGLLEGLNQSVEENAIETAIAKTGCYRDDAGKRRPRYPPV